MSGERTQGIIGRYEDNVECHQGENVLLIQFENPGSQHLLQGPAAVQHLAVVSVIVAATWAVVSALSTAGAQH